MIALVTDSASMLPDDARFRYDVRVVPITITLDDHDYLEGVNLATDEFYDRLAAGASVATAAPSPVALLSLYQDAARAGADVVVSIHTGSAHSATVSAATIAADLVDLPVHVVDTGAASFPVALATIAAARTATVASSVTDVIRAAERTLHQTGSLFVVGLPALARRGGRFVTLGGALTPTTVLRLDGSTLTVLTEAEDADHAIDIIVDATLQRVSSGAIRVGVGHAALPAVGAAILERLATSPDVECIPYVVGPSVGAHTGAGTFGVVWAPLDPGAGGT